MKLSYDNLKPGDRVYVYFPVKKVGCSSKFTSYWRGPFEVKEKLSQVLYKVNCGRSDSLQIIHVDRIKKARKQVLHGEAENSLLDTQACVGNDLNKEVHGDN